MSTPLLIDVNVLVLGSEQGALHHQTAMEWMSRALDRGDQIGIPWHSLLGFFRIATNPRSSRRPLPPDVAWGLITGWLNTAGVWAPLPGPKHAGILGELIHKYAIHADGVSDAHLAALAIEHDLTLVSFDRDFARFREVRWLNPAGVSVGRPHHG